MSTHDEIVAQMEIYVTENNKFVEKGIKSSATRARKALSEIAKLAKMDIIPIAICGFRGYTWIPFRKSKHLTLKIGKPISYELPEEEIVKQWVEYMKENVED